LSSLGANSGHGGHGGSGGDNDSGKSARKLLPCFDLPKHVRKVLYNDLVRNLLMLHVRLAVTRPP
jgi:hypothetical protein